MMMIIIIIIKVDEYKHVTIMLQGINEGRRETNKLSSTPVASPKILEPSTDERHNLQLHYNFMVLTSPVLGINIRRRIYKNTDT
jgi:hypothetical protein